MLRLERMPRSGRSTESDRNRFAFAAAPPACGRECANAVNAASPKSIMFMKWWAGLPKSMMHAAEMQTSAFSASFFSRRNL